MSRDAFTGEWRQLQGRSWSRTDSVTDDDEAGDDGRNRRSRRRGRGRRTGRADDIEEWAEMTRSQRGRGRFA